MQSSLVFYGSCVCQNKFRFIQSIKAKERVPGKPNHEIWLRTLHRTCRNKEHAGAWIVIQFWCCLPMVDIHRSSIWIWFCQQTALRFSSGCLVLIRYTPVWRQRSGPNQSPPPLQILTCTRNLQGGHGGHNWSLLGKTLGDPLDTCFIRMGYHVFVWLTCCDYRL